MPTPTIVGPSTLNLPQKGIRKAVDKPASVCELPSGPSSSPWILDASDAPPACVNQTYEDDFLLVEPLAPEPILPATAA